MTKNDKEITVEPRVLDLFVYFCENPARPISREELIEHVWQGRIVSFAAINRAVGELRKVIETEPAKPQCIKTVSKVGYQLDVLPVIVGEEELIENEPSLFEAKKKGVKNGALFVVLALIIIITSFLFLPEESTEPSFSMSRQTPLVKLKGHSFKGHYSPSGQALLFIHRSESSPDAQVWYQEQDHSPLALTQDNHYYLHAVFASEGEILASRFNNLDQRLCDIVSIDIASRQVSPITTCAERSVTQLAYDPQNRVIFHNYRHQTNQPSYIRAFHRDTGRSRQITHPKQDGNVRGDYLLALSPDYQKLAVVEYLTDDQSQLKIVDLDDVRSPLILDTFGFSSSLAWLDYDHLLLSLEEGLTIYNYASGERHSLPILPGVSQAQANRQGQILFSYGQSNVNLYRTPLPNNSSQQPEPITQTAFANGWPTFANTTNKLAFLSSDGENYRVMVKAENGEAFDTQFPAEIDYYGNLSWSTDDKILVMSANGQVYWFNEQQRIWRKADLPFENIHWVSFNGTDSILLSADKSGDWQIWQLDMLSGETKQITEQGGYSAQATNKAGPLYLTKFNQPGLFKLDLITGHETLLLPDFKITSWHKWQLLQDRLMFQREGNLLALNLHSLAVTEVMAMNIRSNGKLAVSHDLSWIALAQEEASNITIWQAELQIK